MSSSSMPPPPTPFTHRRSRLIDPSQPSVLSSITPPTCVPRKMSLSKGATFHARSSSPTEDDPQISIRHLARRSPTCSQSSLTLLLSDKQDVAQSIADFDKTWSGARGKRLSSHRRSAQFFEQDLNVSRVALPSDEGLGSSISPASDKEIAKSLERALHLVSDKDSGLGSSIGSPFFKNVGGDAAYTSEGDNLLHDSIQDANSPEAAPRTRQSGSNPTTRFLTRPRPALTQSISPHADNHPPLSGYAKKQLALNILAPIFKEQRFKAFHRLARSLIPRLNKHILCLRDLEHTLIYEPLVSTLLQQKHSQSDNPSKSSQLQISQQLFRSFGEFTIQLVADNFNQLSESEQRRASDRPYDNGYFLDFVQQLGHLAARLHESRQTRQEEPTAEDEMAYSPEDEVTLEGGLGGTGELAELVRWHKGKPYSLRTGQPYESTPGIKRESSGAIDEDVARSMARRKKGYVPEYVEMKCSERGCDKVFTRKCDLSKHEKTHSRPFKCPEPTCKYHEMGLPTEKERDRHINDKHAADPVFYRCRFCEFKTKRESNCKQHMEKKHEYKYNRIKGPSGRAKTTPSQTPKTPSMSYSPSVHGSSHSFMDYDDRSSVVGSVIGSTRISSAQVTPFEQPGSDFNFNDPIGLYSNPIFDRSTQPLVQANNTVGFDQSLYFPGHQASANYISPTDTNPMTSNNYATPVTPAYSNLTDQSPHNKNMDITMKLGPNAGTYGTFGTGYPTPSSYFANGQTSRNLSMSSELPVVAGPSHQPFNDPVLGQQLYHNDFTLLDHGSDNIYTNLSAADMTLFPSEQDGAMQDFAMFDDIAFDNNADEFLNFDEMTQ